MIAYPLYKSYRNLNSFTYILSVFTYFWFLFGLFFYDIESSYTSPYKKISKTGSQSFEK